MSILYCFRFKSFAYDKNEVFLESAYSKVVVDMEAYRDNGKSPTTVTVSLQLQ